MNYVHRNKGHHSVELLVSMLFLLIIPKSFFILKEFYCYTGLYIFAFSKDCGILLSCVMCEHN